MTKGSDYNTAMFSTSKRENAECRIIYCVALISDRLFLRYAKKCTCISKLRILDIDN